MDLKVKLVCTGFKNFDLELVQQNYSALINHLEKMDNVELNVYQDIIQTTADVDKFVKETNPYELLIIYIGSFTMGDTIMKIIEANKSKDIFIWGQPEPLVKTRETVSLNSLTAMNMTTSFLDRFNIEFGYVFGDVDDLNKYKYLKKRISALRVKKRLSNTKICVVGQRVPGFFLSSVDELRLRNDYGVAICYLNVGSIVEQAKKLDDSLVAKELLSAKNQNNATVTIPDEKFEMAIRVYLVLKNFAKENGITEFAIKCWPEFQEAYAFAPCWVLGKLTSEGYSCACEADVPGVVTMVIQNELTGTSPFFTDLVNVIEGEDTLVGWHCGQGPMEQASGEVEIIEQPTLGDGSGTACNFAMKHGVVTIAKWSQGKNGNKMLFEVGESVEPQVRYRGTQINIKFEDVQNYLDRLFTSGIEHHHSVAFGNIKEELKEVCKVLGIECV